MSPASALKASRPVEMRAATASRSGGGFEFAPQLIMRNNPASPPAEAIRALRTHLSAQHMQEGRRALAVCGASLDVGCTFVAANLAMAFSYAGVKTLLIDADLRRPSVQSFIVPPQPPHGLAHYLASEDHDFTDYVQADIVPDLSVMFAGGVVSNPQELLAGERFQALMDFCLRDYDITIVDTPAANTCADARRISTVVGYSLVVARRHLSFVDDIKTLIGQLEADHAKVIGTVLNEG